MEAHDRTENMILEKAKDLFQGCQVEEYYNVWLCKHVYYRHVLAETEAIEKMLET